MELRGVPLRFDGVGMVCRVPSAVASRNLCRVGPRAWMKDLKD